VSVLRTTFSLISSKLYARLSILVLIPASILVLWSAIVGWNYYDVRYFIAWYEKYFQPGRILDIYTDPDPTFKVAYPPLAVLIFTGMYYLANTLTSDLVLQIFITKLPLVVSFYLVYIVLVKKYSNIAGFLWLLNILVYSMIFTAQFDLIISLLVLLALYYLTGKRNYTLYAVFISLSALIKHATALLLLPPVLVLLKKKDYSLLLKYIIAVVVVIVPILMPFLLRDPKSFLEKAVFFHAKRPPQQLSIWTIPYYYVNYNLYNAPSILMNAWLPCLLIYLLYVLLMALRESIRDEGSFVLKYNILLLCGFLVLSKVVNITYYMWLLPLVLVLFNRVRQDEKMLKSFIKNYLFGFLWIASYGFFSFFAPLVAGDPIFMFEDWSYMPSDLVYLESRSSRFFRRVAMNMVFYLRSTPTLREIFNILSKAHCYILILVVLVHTVFQVYIIRLALKYLKS
jgi:uncharacterized membrane protein